MFDSLVANATGASGAPALAAWARVENAACAHRLTVMVELLDAAYAASGSAERDQWCIDNWDAVTAHLGAVQRLTRGTADGYLLVALALRDRFPRVAAVFADGLITYSMARMIVQRGALIVDPDALHAVDAAVAEMVGIGDPMSLYAATRAVDAIIAQHDPHAIRRTQHKARDRSVEIVIEDGSGVAQLCATLFTHDATAVDAQLTKFADTVCPADPRTTQQRRADAIAAAVLGNNRLTCLCDTPDCPAPDIPPVSGVVVYLIAHTDTLNKPTSDTPPPDEPTPDEPTPHEPESELLDDPDMTADLDDRSAPATNGSGIASDPDSPDTPPASDETTGLDGEPPALFTTPLHGMTLAEALTATPGTLARLRPAALMGGHLIPGAIAHRAARGATTIPIVHPGLAPPEPRYTPSRKLAAFVRCRDQTCRFPGCHEPATNCDLDHTIPWPYGPTCATNLKALCRRHHLLKTFWGGQHGWRDHQLPDGTIVWTAPDGGTHTTTPGSRLLFPELCEPTAPVAAQPIPHPPASGLTMPRRKTTRTDDRQRRITHERQLNAAEIEAELAIAQEAGKPEAAQPGPEPPPPF